MAGQVYSTHEHILGKREPKPKPIKSFINPGVLTCQLRRGDHVNVPPWPGPIQVTNIEKKPPNHRSPEEVAILASMKRWYIGRQDGQGLPFLTRVDTPALRTAGPQGQQVFIGGEIRRRPEVTVDHICMFTSTCYIDFLLY
jgi:hypothetical protein